MKMEKQETKQMVWLKKDTHICVELANEARKVVVPKVFSKNLSSKPMRIPHNEAGATGTPGYDGICLRVLHYVINLEQEGRWGSHPWEWRGCTISITLFRKGSCRNCSSSCNNSIATTFTNISFHWYCWIHSLSLILTVFQLIFGIVCYLTCLLVCFHNWQADFFDLLGKKNYKYLFIIKTVATWQLDIC